MTSCDIKQVLPAAGPAVSSTQVGAATSPCKRRLWASHSHLLSPVTSCTVWSGPWREFSPLIFAPESSIGTQWASVSRRLPDSASIMLA
eukprot:4608386-Prymnesium_polylepis.1